ncbi:hypothetical protein SETIT_2G120700v2 [Setaria italica]|nr:hypothetical protein SETIT_2G120700v2 [Setaria italica]
MNVGHDPPPDHIGHGPPPPDPMKIATDAQLDRHSEAIVMIVEQKIKGSGRREKKHTVFVASGFIIGKKQDKRTLMVITCAHVISSIIGVSTNPEILKVRLFGSTTESEATILHIDNKRDLALLSVVVPNVNYFPVVRLSSAIDKPPETIVVLVGYYHPANALAKELGERNLLPTMPSAVAGTILGPTVNQGKMLLVNHGCHGMRGTSGSPLICHDTGGAIGVFLGTVSQYHQAIATETVIEFLKEWLVANHAIVNNDDGINDTVENCVKLL